jgi:hypothetical protein
VRIGHLTDKEQRVLRLAANRLGEKGQWNLEELRIEFEELILTDAPIEISGFGLDQIDQIIIGDELEAVEAGPLAPAPGAIAVARLGDMFQLGPHRLICGDATDSFVLRRLMEGDPAARAILTDEPYNVKISGHVTGGAHREFAVASGEMSDAQFLDFNVAWIEAAIPHLCDGGVFGTFIDWRGLPTVHSAAAKLGLTPLNLVVWAKTPAWAAFIARCMNYCRCSKRATRPPSTMSSWARRAAGARTCGLILAPRRWAQTPAAACRTIPQSSRPPCSKTPCSTSPTAATSCSTRFSAQGRLSSPRRRPAASVAASSWIRSTSM